MPHALRRRFWIEIVLGSATGVLAIVTLLWHEWIEIFFRVDPDKGNGSAEWLVVALFMIVTVILAIAARLEWHRAQFVQR
jgi:hypothetical protein